MGFFSAIKNGMLYESKLEKLGLNPRLYPPDFHSKVCSQAERNYAEGANRLYRTNRERTDFVEWGLSRAAEVVATCCLGPHDIRSKSVYAEIIEDLARDWVINEGNGTFELELLNFVNESGYLHAEAARDLKVKREQVRLESSR